LSQVGSVFCSYIFTGRNAAIVFCKASEFSICCEELLDQAIKTQFLKTHEIQNMEIIMAYAGQSQDLF